MTSRPAVVSALQLVRPAAEHLAGYVDALERGYSPSNARQADTVRDELAAIAADPDRYLDLCDDPLALGPIVTLPDGSRRDRIPGLRRWLWDDTGFAGSLGLRWTVAGEPLPPHVLGHIGYSVVPWKQGRGHAKRGLAMLLPLARAQGLGAVEVTTDPDNVASQRVILANGGVLVGPFDKGAPYGHAPGLLYRISLEVRP